MAAEVQLQTQTPQTQSQIPHGKKRAAENGLENEQRLSKRFDLLNLVDTNGTRLYIPVAGSSDAVPPPTSTSNPSPKPLAPVSKNAPKERKQRPPPPAPADDCMLVEDTPHRVYIHDLAAELSDIESDEENPIFLSDIEKHLAKIPHHILRGPEPKPTKDNALVLYSVPSSLSVPEEHDNVRKAIVEARARVRERQASGIGEPERVVSPRTGVQAPQTQTQKMVEDTPMDTGDPDAMEIDDY